MRLSLQSADDSWDFERKHKKPSGKLDFGGGFYSYAISKPYQFAVVAGCLVLFVIATFSIHIFIRDSISSTTITSSNIENSASLANHPHIILIVADDLGWNSLGYQNFDLVELTPTLTGLAASGIILDSFYAQEVCTPSRASLLTGRLPLTLGMQYSMIQTSIPWGLNLTEITLADVLSEAGYSTHLIGKWHLGHFSPRFLPTARGFDTYTGYLNGQSYYWSKRNPDHTHFVDFMYSNSSCYVPYDGDDIHNYSTHLFRDKALGVIKAHDPDTPLFLMISFQAVHDPFVDVNNVHSKGVPKEYLSSEKFEWIKSNVKGVKRQQYAMALSLMDDAVAAVVEQLAVSDLLENSIVVFMSDNGGCAGGGGKNGPLRGNKGSLFEGGVKVDSFMWSPLMPDKVTSRVYQHLFHISDWFPTILSLASVDYVPNSGHELDGFDHSKYFLDAESTTTTGPRQYLLYNYYTSMQRFSFNKWTNGSFAVRNLQYKLMHTYDSATYAAWYQAETILDNDDALDVDDRCAANFISNDGTFKYWLFDLLNDPYETTNLYDSNDPELLVIKDLLYDKLEDFARHARFVDNSFFPSRVALDVWRDNDDTIVPWVKAIDLVGVKVPKNCYIPKLNNRPTASPTLATDHHQTHTHKPNLHS